MKNKKIQIIGTGSNNLKALIEVLKSKNLLTEKDITNKKAELKNDIK